jgi:hypothetical protein
VSRLMFEHFPTYLVSSNIQSREDIAQLMASPDGTITWTDPFAIPTLQEYHPFFMLVDEMENFFSTSERKMLQFIVDVFDSAHFTTGFKQAAAQRKMPNPYLSMIACTVPEWFLSNLSADLFKGGLGRRLFIINRKRTKVVPNPKPPDGWREAKQRVVDHLKNVSQVGVFGEVKRTPAAMLYWDKIYREIRNTKAPTSILDSVIQAKTNHVLKLALILAFDSYNFDLVCTDQHLFDAKALIDSIDEDVKRLTAGLGENPQAGVTARMVEYVLINGGRIRERKLCAVFQRDCPDGERGYRESLNYLVKTEELIMFGDPNDGHKQWLFTPAEWERQQAKAKEKA